MATFAASPVTARDRIDVIALANGDRVTGEVIRMELNSLQVRSKAFGTVSIDWPDVVSLVSRQLFEVTRLDGQRLVGHLDEPGRPGTLRVQSEAEAVEIPLQEVVAIVQQGETIRSARRGRLDLGLNYADAERDLQFSLGADLNFQGHRIRWNNAVDATVSSDAATDRRLRALVSSMVEIPVSRRWYGMVRWSWERNDDLELRSRWMVAGGPFWIARQTPRGRIAIGAGAAQSRESYRGLPESTEEYGLFIVSGNYDRFGPFGTHFSCDLAYLPALQGRNRHRIEARASLRQKIRSDFSINLSPFFSLDSSPPRSSLEQRDWGLVTSIGWNY